MTETCPMCGQPVKGAETLLLDWEAGRVWANGKQITIKSAIALDLLKVFLDHPGKRLSADDLISQVWGDEIDRTPNNLRAGICKLRKELKKLDAKLEIRSFRGPTGGYYAEVKT